MNTQPNGNRSSATASFNSRYQNAQQNSQNGSPAGSPAGVTLDFKTPEELRQFQIPDGYCLIGDYHICRGDFVVLAGPPGVGKSRAAVAAGVCGGSVSAWFNYHVHQHFKTMVFQSENGIVRLHLEFDEIGVCVDDCMWILDPPEIGLAFNDPGFRDAAKKAIDAFKPDLVIIDPWNAVSNGDKVRDFSAAFHNVRAVIPQTLDGAAILIVAHTRKPRPDERSSGRALLNMVAGSYLLGSIPRSVFVLQHASDDVDEDRVVMTCCKNNNGGLGARGAWKRTAGGVFDELKDFNWDGFDSGKHSKGANPWRDIPSILREIGSCSNAALMKDLMERFKITRSTADRWIKSASTKRLIFMDSARGVWEPSSVVV